MRRALVALATVVAFAAIVAATAPASLAGAALERATGGTLILANAGGTFWRGRATLTGAHALRVPLAWTVETLPLLRGEVRVRVFPQNPAVDMPRADIVARRDAFSARDVDIAIPVEAVLAFASRLGPSLAAAGTVRFTTASIEWTPDAFAGGVAAGWTDARFGPPNDAEIPLGTVSATLAAAGGRLSGPVTNDGGAFDVRGTVSLSARGVPDASIAMSPRGGDPAQTRTLTVGGGGADAGFNVDFRLGPR